MTTPLDLGQIAARLMTLSRDLDKQTEAAETLDYEAVTARHDYELAFARAFLSAEGAMDARKQKAILATDREHLDAEIKDAEIKDARLRACKARIATLKVQIDTGRSLGAALRAEVSLAGSGWSA